MNELLSVYTQEGSDRVVGLLYQNQFGAFTREGGRWTALTPRDARFEGLLVNDVLPEHAAEVLDVFDSGKATTRIMRDRLSQEPLSVEKSA
jgi:hypothetical protein